MLIYGAAALSEVDQDTADASLAGGAGRGHQPLRRGPGYGEAEVRMAPWLREHRDEIFLATKTGERDREAAWAAVNESLERLGDRPVDLLQLHAVGDLEELDKAAAPRCAGGRDPRAGRGSGRYVGITGHGHSAPGDAPGGTPPSPFATVLTPLNAAVSPGPTTAPTTRRSSRRSRARTSA